MPTTTYLDSTFAVAAIGDRTDPAGVAVPDYTAEESRFIAQILNPGYLEPALSFAVRQQVTPAMSVRVGSDAAKADYYVVGGTVGGQGNYIVRLDTAAVTVQVPAADASQQRTDEVYLVVRDNTYDASSHSLPQLGYRKGDLGGAAPGPDASWEAFALLASVNVPAAAATVTDAQITDHRAPANLKGALTVTDHGSLTGLADDDHPQYHTDARADGRYYLKSTVDSLLAGKSPTAHSHSGIYATTSHGHDPVATGMTGSNLYYARHASTSGFQDIPNLTNERVTFPSTIVSSSGISKTGDAGVGHYFTFNISGIWAVTCCIRFQGNTSLGERYGALISNNDGTQTVKVANGGFSTGAPVTINLSYTAYFPAGTFVLVEAFQSTGDTIYLESLEQWKNINFALIRRCS